MMKKIKQKESTQKHKNLCSLSTNRSCPPVKIINRSEHKYINFFKKKKKNRIQPINRKIVENLKNQNYLN
ncbi:hypothetical protein HYC85_027048 [Camellia sinensis]|uniref:Uncharacterized protein n=1 Tax=Camellia sinensis TaxID=4442 RepID=A0A7J7G5E2_CAMSI|nr:hypothetical protein HYC85_027048 [Camellia sinensis]